jgi:hypothetical protein
LTTDFEQKVMTTTLAKNLRKHLSATDFMLFKAHDKPDLSNLTDVHLYELPCKPASLKTVRAYVRTVFYEKTNRCRDEKGENREGLWDTSQAEWKKQNTLLASNSETLHRAVCFWTRFCFWNGAGQSSPFAVSHRTLSCFLLFHLLH